MTRPAAPLTLTRVRLGPGGPLVALRIADGRVVAVTGPDDLDGPALDLDGRTVLPGLWDAHVHAAQWAGNRRRVDLSGLASAREVAEALRPHAGIEPAVHAIGDRANSLALDAFSAVRCRGRVEHAQLLTAEDVPRFAELGVTAGVQPTHAVDDRDVADRHWAGRTGRAFAYADLLAAGAALEFGSDAPVAPLDPWVTLAAAVHRTGDDRPAWHPEQRVTVRAALAASARGRALVRVGDPADLVIVDVDPLDADPGTLRAMPVHGTLLGGRWTHGPL
ncbi:amidohydrolase family protein [Streptomyces sp. NPDC087425]|uniref:amidohydrolase family protein n=1 Tax=Streptomyces sp. NPDC087425 TaxID=3365787 RepID=UPI003816570A